MKFCPNCNTAAEDNATFCPVCGATFGNSDFSNASFNNASFNNANFNGNPVNQPPVFTQPVPMVADYDHTAEFDAEDIAENKIYAMLVYLSGLLGIIIALLAKKESAYVQFHVKQALKLMVANTLLAIASAVLAITFLVPIAASIAITVLTVVKIICFFDVCKGNAKEPAIIRNIKFFK